jgi:hypothetical protein
LSIISSLNQVLRNTGNIQALRSWHFPFPDLRPGR